MKKILIIFILCITQSFGFLGYLFLSEEEKRQREERTKHFFGIEGGAGCLDQMANLYIITANPLLVRSFVTPTIGYSVGISGGWQRYDHEKVGLRHTFGARFDFGFDLGKLGGTEREKYRGLFAYSLIPFYYAFDGLFDFVKTDEKHRFGMNLGFILGFNISDAGSRYWGINGAFYGGRLGFYMQFENNIIDLTATVPIFGIIGVGTIFSSTTATLGYKYLF